MPPTRRDVCAMGAGTAALVAIGLPAGPAEAAIAALTGGAGVTEGGVALDAPDEAETAATVPVEVRAEGARAVTLLAPGMPEPHVVTFRFGPLAGARVGATRIRLARSQDLVALAEMEDGSFRMARRRVTLARGARIG